MKLTEALLRSEVLGVIFKRMVAENYKIKEKNVAQKEFVANYP